MMKKLILTVAVVLASGSVVADEYSESEFSSNPVLRPITLPDTMVTVGGAVRYVEKRNGEDETNVNPWIRYGVTDNFTIGFDGLTYRFYNDHGLQLAVNGGVRGATHEDGDDGDDDEWELAYDAGIFGKQVINDQFAINFGLDYISWDSDNDRVNRHEWIYSAGLMYHFAPEWTISAGYSYRNAEKGYDEDDANIFRAGLSKSFGNDFEVGMFYTHSNFDKGQPSTTGESELDNKNAAGISATWRF